MSREMKDSGIKWIGQIPKEAEIVRLRFLTSDYKAGPFGSSLITNNLLPSGEILVYTPEHVTNKNTESEKGNLYLPEERRESMKQFSVNPGDIVFPIVGSLGKAMYIDVSMPNGIINQRLAKFRIKEDSIYIPYFLLLFADSDIYKPYYELNSHGVAVVNITKDMIKDFPFVVYPKEEQKQIMRFLDRKCSAIDTAIEKTKESIEKLEEYKKAVITKAVTKGLDPNVKMKNSELGWIGAIPESWSVSKFKYHTKQKNDRNPGGATVLSLYREYGIVIKDSRDDNFNRTALDTSAYRYVEVNDFVVNKMKAWQGSVAVSEYRGIVSPAYYVYDFLDQEINKRYFHYLMRNKAYTPEYRRLSGGIREGQWDLSEDALNDIKILIPPMEEQEAIAEYLDSKCASIELAIEDKKKQLDTLAEYKKSLIYEYVTGKKEVC